jgi:hypothetical protein
VRPEGLGKLKKIHSPHRVSKPSFIYVSYICSVYDRTKGSEFESQWGQGVFNSTYCPDRLWGSHSLLSKGYRMLFSGGKAARA